MDKTITGLKVQKKNPQRVNIYLDGEFSFGLSRLVAAWLSVGDVLTEEKIAALKDQDTYEVAYQRAVYFIQYRPRTSHEVRSKLVELGFSEDVIEDTIRKLGEGGLLGDERFANAWVESRSASKPRGRRLLAMELRQKKVAEDIIDQALGTVQDEESLALEAARRYSRRLVGLEWQGFKQKLSAYLLRRGFDYSTIQEVLRPIWEEIQENQGGSITPSVKE